MSARPQLWTVGHSSRSLADFLALLRAHALERVVDVRRFPGSRRYPHFSRASLASALAEHGLVYEHAPDLGGHRRPRPDSPHTAWREEAFRGYADHMDTPAFEAALARLLESAGRHRSVLMCAEADWSQCHRSLLSDRLKAEGVAVLHVRDASAPLEHPWTRAARVVDGRLSYRARVQRELEGFGSG